MNLKYFWYKFVTKIKGVAVANSKIDRDAKIEADSVFVGSEINRFSYCGYGCYIINTKIGSFCSISDNVSIGGGQHPLEWVSTSPAFYHGRDSISKRMASLDYDMRDLCTTIENDVWIGRGAYIKSGVVIGNGAVIGMGSVVTKSVEPYSIVAGNPAKVIGQRFDNKTIEKLINIQWWTWNERKLREISPLFNDVEKLFEYDIVSKPKE